MYEAYSMKKEILLWCFLPGKDVAVSMKHSNDTGHADSCNKKHSKCTIEIAEKIDEAKRNAWKKSTLQSSTMLGHSWNR